MQYIQPMTDSFNAGWNHPTILQARGYGSTALEGAKGLAKAHPTITTVVATAAATVFALWMKSGPWVNFEFGDVTHLGLFTLLGYAGTDQVRAVKASMKKAIGQQTEQGKAFLATAFAINCFISGFKFPVMLLGLYAGGVLGYVDSKKLLSPEKKKEDSQTVAQPQSSTTQSLPGAIHQPATVTIQFPLVQSQTSAQTQALAQTQTLAQTPNSVQTSSVSPTAQQAQSAEQLTVKREGEPESKRQTVQQAQQEQQAKNVQSEPGFLAKMFNF